MISLYGDLKRNAGRVVIDCGRAEATASSREVGIDGYDSPSVLNFYGTMSGNDRTFTAQDTPRFDIPLPCLGDATLAR